MIVDVGVGENPKGDVNIDLARTPYCNLVANAEFLPLRENIADLLLCSQVLEHLDNPTQALKEANRVLKSDGMADIDFPKPFFANQARTRFFRFFLNLPFSMFPRRLKHMRRALKGMRKRDPRWYHKCVIKIDDVKKHLDVRQITENGDIFLYFLSSGRKARFFRCKPHLYVTYRLVAGKVMNE